jgi:dolichol-phosphate mannosyltransferase
VSAATVRTPAKPVPVTAAPTADARPAQCADGDRPALSIVVPVYRCAGCLEALVERIGANLLAGSVESFEILLVDDGSPDGAWARILELARLHPVVVGLRLSRNFGQHYAIAAGIERARGKRIAVMDCDLQDPPEALPALLAKSDEGYDVVFARRLQRRDTWFKRATSWGFYQLLTYLTDVPQDHTTANFGVFTRKAIDTVNRMPEAERCFPLMVKWPGFRSATVDIAHAGRAEGASSYSLRRLLHLALNIILSYSDKPLRLVVKLGLLFAMLSFVVVAASVIGYMAGNVAVAGFTSVIASIWLLGGVIVSCIGIVGLYVGRMFNEAKGRPYYVIDEHTGQSGDP